MSFFKISEHYNVVETIKGYYYGNKNTNPYIFAYVKHTSIMLKDRPNLVAMFTFDGYCIGIVNTIQQAQEFLYKYK